MLDGTSRIACVFRLDGGDGHPNHAMLPYGIAFSDDGALTWSKPRMLDQGVGCACPQLMAIPGGGLLLAGGRTGAHNEDVVVWVNALGDGVVWEPYSISYWHNKLAHTPGTFLPRAALAARPAVLRARDPSAGASPGARLHPTPPHPHPLPLSDV